MIFSTCYIKNENACRRFILPQKVCQKFVLSARRIYFLEQSCILPDLRTACPVQQVTKDCNPLQHKWLCTNIFLHTRFFFEPYLKSPALPKFWIMTSEDFASLILRTKLWYLQTKAALDIYTFANKMVYQPAYFQSNYFLKKWGLDYKSV